MFFVFSIDNKQNGSGRLGGLKLTLRRRQICKKCTSQKIENEKLLHEIHWLKTGYSDVLMCLFVSLPQYVLYMFSLLYYSVIRYLFFHECSCYRVQNMLRDKEIEVCERVSMTMEDLCNENQRYT